VGNYLSLAAGTSPRWPHHTPSHCRPPDLFHQPVISCRLLKAEQRRGQLRHISTGLVGRHHRQWDTIAGNAHRQHGQPSIGGPCIVGNHEKCGGSLSGPLSLASDPSGLLQAATKQYVDQRIFRSGDTLTGPLLLSGDPTVPTQAATKNYVDTNSSLLHLGFTMAGRLFSRAIQPPP
jgi:hypothetical protein